MPPRAVQVDRRLRPVLARMERHTLADYAWALPGSSCTPPHGPPLRESPAGPPVWCDRVPKGQKGSRDQFQKNLKKGRGRSLGRDAPAACSLGRAAAGRGCLPCPPFPSSWARCAPHIAKSEIPLLPRPFAAKIAHTGAQPSCSPRIGSTWEDLLYRRGGAYSRPPTSCLADWRSRDDRGDAAARAGPAGRRLGWLSPTPMQARGSR
jgi:hypothetical protein